MPQQCYDVPLEGRLLVKHLPSVVRHGTHRVAVPRPRDDGQMMAMTVASAASIGKNKRT